MEFNSDQSEELFFGMSNQGKTFMVNGRALGSVAEHRDQEVQAHAALKAASQVGRMGKKAFGTFASIGKGIEFKSWGIRI